MKQSCLLIIALLLPNLITPECLPSNYLEDRGFTADGTLTESTESSTDLCGQVWKDSGACVDIDKFESELVDSLKQLVETESESLLRNIEDFNDLRKSYLHFSALAEGKNVGDMLSSGLKLTQERADLLDQLEHVADEETANRVRAVVDNEEIKKDCILAKSTLHKNVECIQTSGNATDYTEIDADGNATFDVYTEDLTQVAQACEELIFISSMSALKQHFFLVFSGDDSGFEDNDPEFEEEKEKIKNYLEFIDCTKETEIGDDNHCKELEKITERIDEGLHSDLELTDEEKELIKEAQEKFEKDFEEEWDKLEEEFEKEKEEYEKEQEEREKEREKDEDEDETRLHNDDKRPSTEDEDKLDEHPDDLKHDSFEDHDHPDDIKHDELLDEKPDHLEEDLEELEDILEKDGTNIGFPFPIGDEDKPDKDSDEEFDKDDGPIRPEEPDFEDLKDRRLAETSKRALTYKSSSKGFRTEGKDISGVEFNEVDDYVKTKSSYIIGFSIVLSLLSVTW